ncbi:MAG TPA: hypothetical protein VM938_07235 [Acidimicrobiales bacterium]|nr:hypothetical protein [Acidimicrobiales bacterium]
MRRIATVVLGAVVVLAPASHLSGGRHATEQTTPAPAESATTETVRGGSSPAASTKLLRNTDGATATVARRWVTAMWTRQPGDGPFDWLDRVAEITDPDLEAELRSARPWIGDATATATVEVGGVYPDAPDPATLTVTCVVHRVTAGGRHDEACVATVTVAPSPDGRLVVVAVR